MGVSGLFPALKKYFKFIKPALGGNVSTASFDINSLIHQVAQLVYGYGEGKDPNRLVRPVKIGTRLEFQVYRIDETNNQIHIIEQLTREELFDKFAAAFLTRLTDIINQIRPKDMVILAVDGVPPQGKIAQQRQRRFAASSAASKDTVFDQNCISPGTEFMIKLDERIREWLASMINSQNIQLPPKVIYSSHLVPGEGEHKILDIYRDPEQMVIVEPSEKKSDKSSSSKTKRQMIGQHVIYGNDNDLIPLLMLLPQDKVYNMRPRHNLDGYDYIDIDSLKMGIRKIMRHNEYYNLDGSDNSAIDDFVVVLSLLGNDFLPGQFSMRNMEDSLYFIFEAYNTVGKPITVLNDDCTNREIDWDAFTYFLIELSRNENYLITGLANTSFLIDRGDKPQLDLSSKMLNASKYDSTSREGRLMSKVNMKTFKNYWYSNALEPQCSRKANKKKGHANICAKFFAFDSSDIANLVVDYLSVIAWVYRYYQLGTWEVSSSLVYRHFHAPLLAELASVAPFLRDENLHNINYNPADPWISPIHHLLAILPSTSLSLVPPEARHLFLPGSPIAYMYPNSFFVELEGLFKEHEARILVPFANIDEIVKVIGEFNLLTYGDVLVNTADEYPENLILQRTLDIEELRSQLDEDTEIIEREKMRQRKLKEEIGICKKRSSGPGRGRGSGRGGFGRGSQSRGFSDRGRGRGFGRGSQGYQGKVTNPRESPKIEIKKPALVKYTTATKNITNGCTWNKNLKF